MFLPLLFRTASNVFKPAQRVARRSPTMLRNASQHLPVEGMAMTMKLKIIIDGLARKFAKPTSQAVKPVAVKTRGSKFVVFFTTASTIEAVFKKRIIAI